MEDWRYKWYLDRCSELMGRAQALGSRLDELIFLLASGAIVFSVTFISKIVGANSVLHPIYLTVSWALLFVSLLFNLMTFVLGYFEARGNKSTLDRWIHTKDEKAPNLDSGWGVVMDVFHFSSLLLLILGLGFMACFIELNFVPGNV